MIKQIKFMFEIISIDVCLDYEIKLLNFKDSFMVEKQRLILLQPTNIINKILQFLYLWKLYLMGCQCSRFPHDKTKSSTFLQTQVGLLDVHITSGKLYEKSMQHNFGKQVNVFFKIQVSNQQYTSRVCSNFNTEGFFNSYFSFFINSNYRANGRILQIQLHKKLQGSCSEPLGKSAVDISKLVGVSQSKQQIKCILNNKNEPLGYANCLLTFTPMQYKNVSFRFQNFILRKQHHLTHKLRVEVLLGEESLTTSVCEDLPKKPSGWTKDILSFKVPSLLKFGKIMLYDHEKHMGETVIKIQELISAKEDEEFLCFSHLYDENNNDLGNIKYSIIVGDNPQFMNEQNKSVKHTNLQINVSRADKSTCLYNSQNSSNSTGVEIVFKNKDSPEKFLYDVDNDMFGENKNIGSNQYLNGSACHFSVFSIEDLSKIDKNSDK